jgi:ankyrin repeat protein
MYPNPQDVLPLPPRPDLDQYRKRAKDLVKACRSGDAGAISNWAARWIADLIELQTDSERPRAREVARRVDQIAEFGREQLTNSQCALNSAQLVIARAHGFASWTRLVHHLAALTGSDSPVSDFEQAADAITDGDVATLRRLLQENPELIRAQSSREHRATLLHYVAANGVENYRQKTPANIVEVARVLLDAGAAVDAEANVYGGGATTLGLVVTSAHPRHAGVQNELADLLLERGARVEAGIVRDCLANGCPEAAHHMAQLGISLDLEEAAGIGRLDVVQRYFDEGSVATSDDKVVAALMMAAWYDQRVIVEYLLERGVDPGVRAPAKGDGQTALHIAAYQGTVQLTEVLLQSGAPVNVNDDTYGTPPLVWALHAWLVEERGNDADYKAVIRMLVNAGARVRPDWIDDDRLRADAEWFAILSRRSTEP